MENRQLQVGPIHADWIDANQGWARRWYGAQKSGNHVQTGEKQGKIS